MNSSELYFGVYMKYSQTEYAPLIELAVQKPIYDSTRKEYFWLFKYSDLEKVEPLVGTIEIPLYREKFEKEEVNMKRWKGDDVIEIKEFPKIYQVITHRKQDDGTVKTLPPNNVDKTLLDRIWGKVIMKQPMFIRVKTSVVAENICRELEITRFDKTDGSFDFEKFFGNRTHGYFKFFYYPIKILHWQGRIEHHRAGSIERRQ